MKDILDQMEEHIAAIRNLQRNFDFHSKRLEKLMVNLSRRQRIGSQIDAPEDCETKGASRVAPRP